MKSKINKVSIISMSIILSLISILGFYTYYFTDWKNNSLSQDIAQKQVVSPEFQDESRVFDNRILLRKNKSITVNKKRLVFKGLKDKMIHLDVYFLELDPEYAYPHYISKANTYKEIRLGDSIFQFLKLSKGALQLKIVDFYKS
jgi:hypothetical protein